VVVEAEVEEEQGRPLFGVNGVVRSKIFDRADIVRDVRYQRRLERRYRVRLYKCTQETQLSAGLEASASCEIASLGGTLQLSSSCTKNAGRSEVNLEPSAARPAVDSTAK